MGLQYYQSSTKPFNVNYNKKLFCKTVLCYFMKHHKMAAKKGDCIWLSIIMQIFLYTIFFLCKFSWIQLLELNYWKHPFVVYYKTKKFTALLFTSFMYMLSFCTLLYIHIHIYVNIYEIYMNYILNYGIMKEIEIEHLIMSQLDIIKQ